MTKNIGTNNALLSHATVDCEQSVLGGILIRPESLRDLPELEVDDFGDARTRIVFGAIRNLEARRAPIDVQTLQLEIEKQGKLEAIGGVAYLGELALRVPTPDNLHEYTRHIRDAHVKRRVMIAASDIVSAGRGLDVSGEELLDRASKSIGAIDGRKPEETRSIGELAKRRLADVERFAQEQLAGRRALSGAPTGVADLDAKIGGWQFEIVNIVAARPGMGKSALARSTAAACARADIGVHTFSLEDSWHALTDRALAAESGVPAMRIRTAEFGPGDVGHLYKAMVALDGLSKRWKIDDRGGLTAAEMVRAMRRQQERNGTRVAICDYVQLLKPRDPRMKDHEHLGDCMQTFAESAKIDGVAWVVLSQFNRELEKRLDKRPLLSDLRGSGEIEEKCKIAVALYRGSYYGGRPKRDIDYDCDCPEAVRSCAHAPSMHQWEQQIQLLVLKGGNGPTGRVFASWDGATVRVY